MLMEGPRPCIHNYNHDTFVSCIAHINTGLIIMSLLIENTHLTATTFEQHSDMAPKH